MKSIIMVMAALLAAACAHGPKEYIYAPSVTAVVTDASGAPVSGAAVYGERRSEPMMTNEKGWTFVPRGVALEAVPGSFYYDGGSRIPGGVYPVTGLVLIMKDGFAPMVCGCQALTSRPDCSGVFSLSKGGAVDSAAYLARFLADANMPAEDDEMVGLRAMEDGSRCIVYRRMGQ